MTDDQSREILTRHYAGLWLGQSWSATAAAWQAEYTAVSTGAFSPLLVTQTQFDGGAAQGQKQLEQMLRVQVLQNFRGSLDPDYAAAIYAGASIDAARPTVMYPIFPRSFAH